MMHPVFLIGALVVNQMMWEPWECLFVQKG